MSDQNNDCIFCKIIKKQAKSYTIYEDEDTVAFLNIYPVSKGHTLVVPKNHAKDLVSGTEDDAVALMRTVYKIAPVIIKILNATGFNLGMNHGRDAGQEVDHTHFHIMPRYHGVERSFSELDPAEHEMQEVADELKQALSKI